MHYVLKKEGIAFYIHAGNNKKYNSIAYSRESIPNTTDTSESNNRNNSITAATKDGAKMCIRIECKALYLKSNVALKYRNSAQKACYLYTAFHLFRSNIPFIFARSLLASFRIVGVHSVCLFVCSFGSFFVSFLFLTRSYLCACGSWSFSFVAFSIRCL